jgi:mycothiol synthase
VTLEVQRCAGLADEIAELVGALVRAAPGAAENPPLSEQAQLHLRSGAPFSHFTCWEGDSLLGYLQVHAEDGIATAELVTAPARPDVAVTLTDALIADAGASRVLLWAHGADSAASVFGATHGWQVRRQLLQLRRPLDAADQHAADTATPDPTLVIRPFRPGLDDLAWLRVNARAFAHHAEQGGWTQADLTDRIGSEWFDADGFLLAERDSRLLGFHWTKIHHEMSPAVGEVYVIGVDPDAQGQRLGDRLLALGLAYLAGRGLGSVLLYVEADNVTAVRLYQKWGFSTFSTDVQYAPAG